MKVREIMTEPPLTCHPETSLRVAATLMREADYGTLPVIDVRGQLVGIITDRDVALEMAKSNRNALNITVHEAMTHKVATASMDEDVRSALATMKRARVRRLPVHDAAGRLQGLLSLEDIVVRGLETGCVDAGDIVATLRALYVRTPAVVDRMLNANEFTPG